MPPVPAKERGHAHHGKLRDAAADGGWAYPRVVVPWRDYPAIAVAVHQLAEVGHDVRRRLCRSYPHSRDLFTDTYLALQGS